MGALLRLRQVLSVSIIASLLLASKSLAQAQTGDGFLRGVVLLQGRPIANALVQVFDTLPADVTLTSPGGLQEPAKLPGINIIPGASQSPQLASRQPLFVTTTGDDGAWEFHHLLPNKQYLITTQALNRGGAVALADAQILVTYDSKQLQRGIEVEQHVTTVAHAPTAPAFSRNVGHVYYLSDRFAVSDAAQIFDETNFLNQRSDAKVMKAGSCVVELDGQHRLRCTKANFDRFLPQIRQIQEQSIGNPHNGLVFYFHGFNNSFADAMRSAAIISSRLNRPVFAYDWASAKKGTPTGYAGDEETLKVSLDQHDSVLMALLESPGSQNSAIVAHSMGSRIVVDIARALKLCGHNNVHTNAIVLASADLYVDEFRINFDALAALGATINNYASWKDIALFGSAAAHDGHKRVGDDVSDIAAFTGVISVDASPVGTPSLTDFFGHGYITGQNHILDDVRDLLGHVTPRQHLIAAPVPNKYFAFRN